MIQRKGRTPENANYLLFSVSILFHDCVALTCACLKYSSGACIWRFVKTLVVIDEGMLFIYRRWWCGSEYED